MSLSHRSSPVTTPSHVRCWSECRPGTVLQEDLLLVSRLQRPPSVTRSLSSGSTDTSDTKLPPSRGDEVTRSHQGRMTLGPAVPWDGTPFRLFDRSCCGLHWNIPLHSRSLKFTSTFEYRIDTKRGRGVLKIPEKWYHPILLL